MQGVGMKKYIIPLFLTCNIMFANDGGEQQPEQPNCLMQALAAIISCPIISFTAFCRPDKDVREHNPLHNTYVAPYDVAEPYDLNDCCALTHYCCPCCVPQQLR